MRSARRNFASDNNAGICPEAMEAIRRANSGHGPGYGADEWTALACDRIRECFETQCEVFFVFNGTAANALSLAAAGRGYHAVIAHELAHVESDECGAPEFFTGGSKIIKILGKDGKVTVLTLRQAVSNRRDLHFPMPRTLSVTQATEVGTVYTIDELQSIGATAKELGLVLHMDGARFANAVATLQCAPKEITWQCGVDILSFGGTKNGMACGEAVVIFNPQLAAEFDYRIKQGGQLCSKMRFLSAPWTAMLSDGNWIRHAAHANHCAKMLADRLQSINGIRLLFPVEANSVFVDFDPTTVRSLHSRGWHFYEFPAAGGYRLMCSWDTREADVDEFMEDVLRVSRTRFSDQV